MMMMMIFQVSSNRGELVFLSSNHYEIVMRILFGCDHVLSNVTSIPVFHVNDPTEPKSTVRKLLIPDSQLRIGELDQLWLFHHPV
jgi:hypothetical protein